MDAELEPQMFFLEKAPVWMAGGGGGGLSEDTLSKANVYIRTVETVFFVSTLSFWGGKPFSRQGT